MYLSINFSPLLQFFSTRRGKLIAQSQVLLLLIPLCFIETSIAGEEFSPKIVHNWIAAQRALEQWGKAHQEELSKYEEKPDQARHPTEMTAEDILRPLKASGLYESAKQVVGKNGFNSMEDWANATIKIIRTSAAIEIENRPEMFDTSKLEKLMNSPRVSDKQKAAMRQAMERNIAIAEKMANDVSEEEKSIVRPFLKSIRKLMGAKQ